MRHVRFLNHAAGMPRNKPSGYLFSTTSLVMVPNYLWLLADLLHIQITSVGVGHWSQIGDVTLFTHAHNDGESCRFQASAVTCFPLGHCGQPMNVDMKSVTFDRGGTKRFLRTEIIEINRCNEPTDQPKTQTGSSEMIRHLKIARDTAVKSRSQAMVTLKTLIINAPADLRNI